jgi:hypothetical protein
MMKLDEKALTDAAAKLRKLRLTDVSGRKEHPADTVKSVMQRGLGGLYDDAAVEYILRHGVRYYLKAILAGVEGKVVVPRDSNEEV